MTNFEQYSIAEEREQDGGKQQFNGNKLEKVNDWGIYDLDNNLFGNPSHFPVEQCIMRDNKNCTICLICCFTLDHRTTSEFEFMFVPLDNPAVAVIDTGKFKTDGHGSSSKTAAAAALLLVAAAALVVAAAAAKHKEASGWSSPSSSSSRSGESNISSRNNAFIVPDDNEKALLVFH